MRLYEIAENYRNLLDLMEDGEIPVEVIKEGLEQLDGDLVEKLNNITYMIKELDAGEKALKEEEERLKARREIMVKNRKNLSQYAEMCMKLMHKTKVKGDKFSWNIQKNPPKVIIDDVLDVDPKYIETVTESKIDKQRILQDLKLGKEVPGCRMEQTESLRIR